MNTRRLTKIGVWSSLCVSIGLGATLKTAVVEGTSMTPTLKPGQRILTSKAALWFGVHDGDIVLIEGFGRNGGYIVKRVYRTAGQQVDSGNTPESFMDDPQKLNFEVPKGKVFVLGDNLASSEDSRQFGPIPIDHIVAKVIFH